MNELEPDLRTEEDDAQRLLADDPAWEAWLDLMNQNPPEQEPEHGNS